MLIPSDHAFQCLQHHGCLVIKTNNRPITEDRRHLYHAVKRTDDIILGMSLHKCYFLNITTHKYYKYASVVVTCSNKNAKQPCQELSPHLYVFTSTLK